MLDYVFLFIVDNNILFFSRIISLKKTYHLIHYYLVHVVIIITVITGKYSDLFIQHVNVVEYVNHLFW